MKVLVSMIQQEIPRNQEEKNINHRQQILACEVLSREQRKRGDKLRNKGKKKVIGTSTNIIDCKMFPSVGMAMRIEYQKMCIGSLHH